MQDSPIQGSIAGVFLPRVVAGLHRDEFDGALRVTLHDTTKVVYFKTGEIASAASNAEPDRLANILIREGRLTQAQLDMAKSKVAAGGSLGKTLIDMGFLTPAELLQGARRQVREILTSCFTLSSGDYEAAAGPLPPEVTSLGLATRRLIFECLMQAADRRFIVREVGSMESVYRPTETLEEGIGLLKLEPKMEQIARMLDGGQTLRDISGRTSLDDFAVGRIVLALEVLGMAERIGEPPPAEGVAGVAPSLAFEDASGPAPPFLGAAEDFEGGAGGDDAIPSYDAAADATSPPEAPAEPPAIPPEELPAFALDSDEAGAWQVDPDTGEKVRLGPVEVTFDGRVAPGPAPATLPRLLMGAAAVTAVLAGTVLYLALRRGPDGDTVARADNTPIEGSAPAAPPPSTRHDPAPAADGDEAPAAPTPAPAPRSTQEAAPPTAPVPQRSIAAPPAGPEALPDRPADGGAASSGGALFDDHDYLKGVRLLEQGDTGGAVRAFARFAEGLDPSGFTLQLLIACQQDTLRTALERASGGPLFFVPYTFNGRDCYRACFGVYPGLQAARAAKDDVPAALTEAGAQPVVISISRLHAR